jgi:hypothetical protein
MGTVDIKVSTIKGAVVNQSKVENAANVAMGQGSTANTGSVVIK